MLFNVPQYTDVQDKVAGPLTVKQLGWLFGMGGVLIFLHSILDELTFWIAAIPVVALFATFAFYKPNGQPLINYVFYGISFIFRPKVYTWRREQMIQKKKKRKTHTKELHPTKNSLESQTISSLAKTLDSDGQEHDIIFDELIKKG